MFCIKCGKELPDEAQFCLKCGTAVPGQSGTLQKSGYYEYQEFTEDLEKYTGGEKFKIPYGMYTGFLPGPTGEVMQPIDKAVKALLRRIAPDGWEPIEAIDPTHLWAANRVTTSYFEVGLLDNLVGNNLVSIQLYRVKINCRRWVEGSEARSSSVPQPAVSSQKTTQVQPAASVQKPVKKHECILDVKGHNGEVNSIAWSPADGDYIASGGSDGIVKVWKALSYDLLLKYLIVASGRGNSVSLWRTRPDIGKCILTYNNHTGAVNSIACSPNGKYLASGSTDKTIHVWEALTGKEVLIYKGHTGAVNSVAYSPDGKYIASGGTDKTIHVWEALTGKQILIYKGHIGKANLHNSLDILLVRANQEHFGEVKSIAYSPDGKYIASGGFDKTIHVWEALTGKRVHIYKGHTDAVNSVTYSSSGTYIASGSSDKTIHIWHALTGDRLQQHKGHTGAVNSVAWSPDGKYIASAGFDKTAIVWDAFTGKQVVCITPLHSDGWVKSYSWYPDSKHFTYGTKTGDIQVWKLAL